MPTYAFSLTREEMARKVLGKLGVLDPHETTSAQDLEVVSDAIDMRLKELHAIGVLWWQVGAASTSVALTGGSVTAAISATDYLFPVTMALIVGTEEQPIKIIGHREYQAIPDKEQTGTPEAVHISGATCRFWPVPSSNGTAKLTYQSVAEDASVSASPDLGAGMARAFVDIVAGDLVDEYQVNDVKAARLLAKQAQGLSVIRILNSQRVDSSTVQTEYY